MMEIIIVKHYEHKRPGYSFYHTLWLSKTKYYSCSILVDIMHIKDQISKGSFEPRLANACQDSYSLLKFSAVVGIKTKVSCK